MDKQQTPRETRAEDLHTILSRFHSWEGQQPTNRNGHGAKPKAELAEAGDEVREISYEEALRKHRAWHAEAVEEPVTTAKTARVAAGEAEAGTIRGTASEGGTERPSFRDEVVAAVATKPPGGKTAAENGARTGVRATTGRASEAFWQHAAEAPGAPTQPASEVPVRRVPRIDLPQKSALQEGNRGSAEPGRMQGAASAEPAVKSEARTAGAGRSAGAETKRSGSGPRPGKQRQQVTRKAVRAAEPVGQQGTGKANGTKQKGLRRAGLRPAGSRQAELRSAKVSGRGKAGFQQVLERSLQRTSGVQRAEAKAPRAQAAPDRSQRVTTRLSRAEQRRIQACATRAGLTVSAYLRQCALAAEDAEVRQQTAGTGGWGGARTAAGARTGGDNLQAAASSSGLGGWLTLLRQRFLASPRRFAERA